MNVEHREVGFASYGPFCTYSQIMEVLGWTQSRYGDVLPIVPEADTVTDTRFEATHDLMREMECICGRRMVGSTAKTKPIGPRHLLDALIIRPYTSNTLVKLADGVTDTVVTMVTKAHLRNRGPTALCPATNDDLAVSARNISIPLNKKNVYFVPFQQDDPARKPTSLVADLPLVPVAVGTVLEGCQLQPVLLGPQEAD